MTREEQKQLIQVAYDEFLSARAAKLDDAYRAVWRERPDLSQQEVGDICRRARLRWWNSGKTFGIGHRGTVPSGLGGVFVVKCVALDVEANTSRWNVGSPDFESMTFAYPADEICECVRLD